MGRANKYVRYVESRLAPSRISRSASVELQRERITWLTELDRIADKLEAALSPEDAAEFKAMDQGARRAACIKIAWKLGSRKGR